MKTNESVANSGRGMRISEQLKAAKLLIDTPWKHLQNGLYADGLNETPSGPWSETACKFCSIGAMARIAGITTDHDLLNFHTSSDMVGYLDKAVGSVSTAAFNDTRSHREVMDKWDEAIALVEADEQAA